MDDSIIIKRNAKDSVFTHLFRDKRYVLQLYQALHPEATDVTEGMIRIVTLHKVFVGDIYNDLGFMIDKRLVILAEAQSTWTENIVVRALLYLAQTYHDYIVQEELNLYSSRRLALPRPELYVIYTGNRRVKKRVLSLSDEFFGGEMADVDVRVHVLTGGAQNDIVSQYVTFTKVLDGQIRLYGRTREAIVETIRICKDQNVLKPYLSEHEQEAQNIMMTLFDDEQIYRAYRKERDDQFRAEGREQGRVEGREQGRAEGQEEGREKKAVEVAKNLLKEGLNVEMIARVIDLPVSEVNALKAQMAL